MRNYFSANRDRLFQIRMVGLVTFLLLVSSCADLTVFVPKVTTSVKDIEKVSVNEDGYFQVALKKGAMKKGEQVDLYIEKLSAPPESLSLTEDMMETDGSVSWKKIEIDSTEAPSERGQAPIPFKPDSVAVLDSAIEPDAYYMIQAKKFFADKSRPHKTKVLIVKAAIKPLKSIAAIPSDSKVRIEWEPVDSALAYDIFADEAGTMLLATTPKTFYEFESKTQAPPKEIWIRAARGSLASKAMTKAVLSFSEVKIVSILPPEGVYARGAKANFEVEFSANVFAQPDLTLPIDATGRKALYTSGTGSKRLIFAYTIGSDEESFGLQISAPSPIKDANDNLVISSLPPNPPMILQIDTILPTAPVSPGFSSTVSSNGTFNVAFGAGIDENLKSYQAKLCLNPDCQTACSNTVVTETSPAAFTGVTDGSYHACVQTEDLAGQLSPWTPSVSTVLVMNGPSSVLSVSSSKTDANYTVGEQISILVFFSRAVSVTGSGQLGLTLETGATDRVATYLSGSSTNTLTFRYTVQAGDSSTDLQYATVNALTLGTGTIKDAAGHDAVLTLPALTDSQSLAGSKAIQIDTTAPSSPSSVAFSGSTSTTLAFPMTWTNGNDANFAAHEIKLCAAADCSTTCSTSTQIASTPASMSGANGSTYYGCVRTLDTAGNTSAWVPTSGSMAVDTSVPTITSVSSSTANGTYKAGQTVAINVLFSENVIASNTGDLGFTLETGATDSIATYNSGSGTNTLTFTYTIASGDMSLDLEAQSLAALTLGGSGTIKDTSGNNANLALPALGGASSLAGAKNIAIDTAVPTVTVGADAKTRVSYSLNATTGDVGSSIATYAWTKLSGTGTLTFATGTAEDTTVVSDTEGTFTIRLTVTDAAGNTASDDLVLVWDTTAPAVNVGGDISTNVSTSINATSSDALSGIASYSWTMVSGPGTITFGTPTAEDSTVSASADGTYVLQLSVTDQAGNTASDTLNMVLNTAGASVNVGADRSVKVSTSIDATVSSPSPIVSYAWTKVSGPGTITFGTPTAEDSTASASADGTYVLRLSVTDDAANVTSDDLTFIWDTTLPTVNAGADLASNVLQSIDATTSDSLSGITTYAWTKVSGPGTVTFGSAATEDTTVTASADGTYVLQLTVTDASGNTANDSLTFVRDTTVPTVAAGSDLKTNAAAALNATVTDSSAIATFAWTKISGPGILTFTAATAEDTSVSASADGTYVIRLTATDNVGNSSYDELTLVRDTAAPLVNVGIDRAAASALSIDASSSDALSGLSTYAWSMVSGPGTITFGTATAEDSTVSASADGAYVIQLTVTDQAGNNASDTLNFTWDTTNPSVNVGADKSVRVSTLINASVTEASAIASYAWSKTSGPGTITFTAAANEDTSASASVDGTYVLRLTVVDNVGNTSFDELSFVWDTTGPSVNAGVDLFAKTSTSISATTSDSLSGIASYAWTKVSGPGTITFGTATAEDTTVSASAEGNYVLQLAVTDNAGNTSNDTLTLVWDTTAPSVNAGSDLTTATSASISATSSDALSGIATYAWTKVSGPGTITFGSAAAEDTTASASADGSYVLQLSVTDLAGNIATDTLTFVWDTTGPSVNVGADKKVRISTAIDATVTDSSAISTYAWTKVSGPGTITFTSASTEDTSASASLEGTYVLRLTATDSSGNSSTDDLTFVWDTTAPSVNAGSDLSAAASANLLATTSDSLAGISTYAWTKVSGPGTITFGTATAEDSTVSASADGTYVLQLTVVDQAGNSANDTMTLVWDTANPTVNVGADKKVRIATLVDATVSDNATIASYAWTKISGPGTVTFSAATSEDSNASANADGTYVLRLTVTDAAGNSAYDELSFVWDTTAPSVNAGVDLYGNAVRTLDSTVSDATAGVSSYAWTKVSGPGTITFGTATAEDTTVTASVDGTYVLQLSVTDQAGNTAADTVTLIRDIVVPTVNVGADKLVKVTTAIDATSSDTSPVTYAWTKTSGPGTITYSAATAEDSTASASVDGSYVLRLTVTDSAGNSAYDELTFEWDTTAPTSPSSVGFAGSYSTSLTFPLSWGASTDTHFSTYNAKICTNIDCATGCTSAGATTALTLSMTGVNGSAYYGCVNAVDTLGNATAYINSPGVINVDTSAPTAPTISIAAAASITNATSNTLTLSASGASQMYITNTAACASGGSWETYATSKTWSLGQTNSTATVYVKYRDNAGNESTCVNDTILHDSVAPSSASLSINSNAYTTAVTGVTLTLAATEANTLSEMYITNTAGCGSGGTWEAFSGTKSWTLGQTNATTSVYVKFKDSASNVSSCVSDSIIHSDTAPTSTSISINAAAANSTGGDVTLTLAANQATEMYITNVAGCASGGAWETFGTSPSWTLAPTAGLVGTVYVKFRSASTLESSCINDAISVLLPEAMLNGGFESGLTSWTNEMANGWVVVGGSLNTGTNSAQTNGILDSQTACLTQVVNLTSAPSDYSVSFNWYYGTEGGYDFAKFFVDSTEMVSRSGAGSWEARSYVVPKGGSRTLKWCYSRDNTVGDNGDVVRLDNVKLSPIVPLTPASFTTLGFNQKIRLDWTAPAQLPEGYIILRGTSSVPGVLVNGTSYSQGGTVSGYTVVYKGSNLFAYDTGLTNGTTYHYAIFSYNPQTKYSLLRTATGVPEALNVPTAFSALSGTAKTHLYWTAEAGGAQTGYMIVRNTGSAVTFSPTQGTAYSVGAVTGGTVVYKGSAVTLDDTGLTNGTNYYYKIWAYGAGNTYSTTFRSANVAPVACNGTIAYGTCWKFSAVAQSCNSICQANGMVFHPGMLDAHFANYPGDNVGACQALFSTIGVVADTTDHVWLFGGPKGCSKITDGRFMAIGDGTSDGSFYKYDGALACPCY